MILLSSCAHEVTSRPHINWFIGDSEHNGIVSANGDLIQADWIEFDEYTCIVDEDSKKLMKYILNLEGELRYGR